MARPTSPKSFLTAAEAAGVHAAVAEAERRTSAELKVVLARHCWGDLKRKARRIFRELGLDRTEGRNCVLILLILTNREFLIYGDEGIHARVGQGFWDDVRREMQEAFGRNAFGDGIAAGVRRIGEKLAQHFPCQRNDVDEISNEIVYRR
ncbi:MAG TPA: TPM domain-containing protein [Sedimentisphaerales bacterium]|nr:TPM domain-containing protein [Sedimentisphaerales bacterium]HRS11955.1 TPM domain-containing protein [Sedimentisphaerales bacterium]HRV49781.1 TPM domain-containing protein [Sedimentisphaerales bacterium]